MPGMNPNARDLGSSFGAHVFLWASDSSTAQLDRAIRAAARLGLDFVQVSLSSLALDLAALRASLQSSGAACLTGLAVPPGVWAGRRDGALLRYLRQAIDATAALDCGMLSGALYTPMGEKSDPGERPEELKLIRGELKEAAQYAATLGIRLGLEPLNRYETSLLNTCAQVLEFIAEVDEPNLCVHLDTFHMNIEEGDLYGAITQAKGKLGYIQLAESDRGVPGDGHVPWEAVFEGLRDADFSGPLAFESFTIENVVLAKAACLWRDVVGDPDVFVVEGRASMRLIAEKVGYKFPE
jgi:D-psicose/D-tagatose/L-ribulose 3-epimerase